MDPNDLLSGTPVGLDANVFIYHFTGRSRTASHVIELVESGEIDAVTSREAVQDVLHRLMTLEAVSNGLISGKNPARKLKARPEIVRTLHRYFADTCSISALGVRILPALDDPVRRSQPLRDDFGLLAGDSLLAATLLANGVGRIVTADMDFLRVVSLKTFLLDDIGSFS